MSLSWKIRLRQFVRWLLTRCKARVRGAACPGCPELADAQRLAVEGHAVLVEFDNRGFGRIRTERRIRAPGFRNNMLLPHPQASLGRVTIVGNNPMLPQKAPLANHLIGHGEYVPDNTKGKEAGPCLRMSHL